MAKVTGVVQLSTKLYSRRRILLSAASATALLGASKLASLKVAAQEAEYPEVNLIATEYEFEMEATTVGGFNRLVMDNQGMEDHHAILFRINDDATMDDFQEALMSGDIGSLLEVSSAYGGPNVGPGGTSSVIAFLDPGMYMAVCVVPDEDGIPHVAHGMIAPLEVTDVESDLEAPETTGTISLVDMDFVGLPETVDAGDHVWEISNDGAQLHEIAVLRLADGLTVDDVFGLLTDEPTEAIAAVQGPPFVSIGGTAPKSQFAVNYLEISLEAGTHVAICFIPDIETGMPHFLMGMIAQFEVV